MTVNDVIESGIVYFPREDREFLPITIELARKRAIKRNVETVCVFTHRGDGALKAAQAFSGTGIRLLAVTFPSHRSYVEQKGEQPQRVPLGISDPDIERQLREAGAEIVRGPMPFEEILIPNASDPKSAAIRHTLKLLGTGMGLCIQAILIACDSGKLVPHQEVISMTADTAILATASTSTLLFSPYEGMEVREIICKPRVHTLARFGLHQKTEGDSDSS